MESEDPYSEGFKIPQEDVVQNEHHFFDDLARVMANGDAAAVSRSRVLKVVGAAILGGTFSFFALPDDASARGRGHKHKHRHHKPKTCTAASSSAHAATSNPARAANTGSVSAANTSGCPGCFEGGVCQLGTGRT